MWTCTLRTVFFWRYEEGKVTQLYLDRAFLRFLGALWSDLANNSLLLCLRVALASTDTNRRRIKPGSGICCAWQQVNWIYSQSLTGCFSVLFLVRSIRGVHVPWFIRENTLEDIFCCRIRRHLYSPGLFGGGNEQTNTKKKTHTGYWLLWSPMAGLETKYKD